MAVHPAYWENYFEFPIHLGNLSVNFLFYSNVFENDSSWITSTHIHSCFELHYVLDGVQNLIAGNRVYTLRENALCLVPPQINHYTCMPTSKTMRKICLFFYLSRRKAAQDEDSGEFAFYSDLFARHKQLVFINQEAPYKDYLLAIVSLFQKNTVDSRHKVKALFTLLFLEIADLLMKQQNLQAPASSSALINQYKKSVQAESAMIMKIENYLFRAFKENITLSDLAKRLCLSEKQTDRTLRRLLGMGFKQLLLKWRMEHAYELIARSDLTYAQIAAQTGYKSYNGFYIAFKKTFGVTPQEIRLSVKNAE